MELDIGMSREGLRKLANEILAECDRNPGAPSDVEIVRYVKANGPGPELVLTFSNDDMEDRDDITEDTAFWEMQR
jgi:hypothetical protein